jgi:hypothetical protein
MMFLQVRKFEERIIEFEFYLDDLTLLDGTSSPSAAVFGNQWRLDKSVNKC